MIRRWLRRLFGARPAESPAMIQTSRLADRPTTFVARSTVIPSGSVDNPLSTDAPIVGARIER